MVLNEMAGREIEEKEGRHKKRGGRWSRNGGEMLERWYSDG